MAEGIDTAAPHAAPGKRARTGLSSKPWWPWTRRALWAVFFVLVGTLLFSQARDIEWNKVVAAVRELPAWSLALAAALAAVSHALYSTFDLLGKWWTGHALPVRTVVPVTFVSYAFNLNLGSLVGGFAFRYRLYSRLGLDNNTITRVLGMSLVTNWLGYLVLAGVVFAIGAVTPPPDWRIGAMALRALGAALVAVAAAYVLMCAFAKRRSYAVRGHEFELPPLRVALLQLAMSCVNWAVIAGVIFVLLQQQVPYPTVLGVLLIAAVAGVLTHIPAGLGVLEAVFIALLAGDDIARSQILGALLAYRFLYYLAPLVIATVVFLVIEARARKLRAAGTGRGEQ